MEVNGREIFVKREPVKFHASHKIKRLNDGNFEVVCNHFCVDKWNIKKQIRDIIVAEPN